MPKNCASCCNSAASPPSPSAPAGACRPGMPGPASSAYGCLPGMRSPGGNRGACPAPANAAAVGWVGEVVVPQLRLAPASWKEVCVAGLLAPSARWPRPPRRPSAPCGLLVLPRPSALLVWVSVLVPGCSARARFSRLWRFARLVRHERLRPSKAATGSSLVHCWQKRASPPRPSGTASDRACSSAAGGGNRQTCRG